MADSEEGRTDELDHGQREAAPTGATAPAARIVNGVKVYGGGVTAVRALDGVSAAS